jgi:hypothetical protein
MATSATSQIGVGIRMIHDGFGASFMSANPLIDPQQCNRTAPCPAKLSHSRDDTDFARPVRPI